LRDRPEDRRHRGGGIVRRGQVERLVRLLDRGREHAVVVHRGRLALDLIEGNFRRGPLRATPRRASPERVELRVRGRDLLRESVATRRAATELGLSAARYAYSFW
jgi:hypothetical protein